MSNGGIGEALRRTAARVPDRIAVVDGERHVRYGELDAQADRIAQAMLAHGLGRGHNMAILSPNSADYPAVYFGAARTGGILAHLSVRYTADDLRYVLDRCDAEAVFVHADCLAPLVEARADLPKLRTVVVLESDASAAGPDALTLDAFVADAPAGAPDVAIGEDDPFAITFTGGTTGFPKGVLVTHRARFHSSAMAWSAFQLREDDLVAMMTPMFHVAGLFSWYTTGVYGGCGFAFLPSWDAQAFVDLVAREKVTAACVVPTQLGAFMNEEVYDADKLASLRYINYGGSPTPVSLLERIARLRPDIVMFEHYGQSEIGPACFRPPEDALKKPTSVGVPFADVTLRILGPDDAPLPRGSTGEIAVKSPIIFHEYYKEPEQTAAAFTDDGWLKTGDLGYQDDEGYVFLVDRSKDLIISGGENVYPAEIENALYDHEAVAEAAVFGIPDDRWGEVPAAHVVLKAGRTVSEAALADFVAGKIARHKRPRTIRFVDELPKTAIGKIRKNVLREPYWAGRARAI